MSKRKDHGQFTGGGLHPFSYHPFVFNFIPDLRDKMVVDCGCGKGVWGYLIRAIRPVGSGVLLGVDLNPEYLRFCKQYKIYDQLINADATKLPIKSGSIDFLLCSEVIEHLIKNKGDKLLKEIDRVMSKGGRAILTTPNMRVDTLLSSGLDAHYSKWNVDDFKKRGYRVYGIGLKTPFNLYSSHAALAFVLGYVFTPLSFYLPSLSGFLIAVKDFK